MNRPALVFTCAIALLATVVALAGCASERAFLEGVKAEQTAPLWRNVADRGE